MSCSVGAAMVVSSSASMAAVAEDRIKLCPASKTNQLLLDALSRFKLTPFVSSLLVIRSYITLAITNVPDPIVVPNSNNVLTLLASSETIR